MAANSGISLGWDKDKGSGKGKKVAKAVLLGGGYSGYERARNQGQGRVKAAIKARLGGTAYSAYKGLKDESLAEKARKYTRGEKGAKRVATGVAVAGAGAAYYKHTKGKRKK